MSDIDLKRKAEELEQTLHKQFEVIKSDSQTWVKLGGTVLISGLVTFGIVRAIQGRKSKKIEDAVKRLEQEGMLSRTPAPEDRYYYHPAPAPKSSFWAPVGQRIMMAAFEFVKAKVMADLAERIHKNDSKKH
ncbi:hypothetical protein KIH41_00480 [Litoribacter ruber]|uniref:Uncharacterized protein n=1 Tax=Litoribacter ruber TaxID=702568 RepID=A0AAP2G1Y7_9BACT|nr:MULTISPECIES: hypothetical protein [Litoribacter]MBS9525364.1 hypothetical protein [Litoribacter alkaliphilus]MBT0809750.1 hypothetical protein [Litoribacter ruber]